MSRYHLTPRPENTLLFAMTHLLAQFTLDVFSRILQCRLWYIRTHQHIINRLGKTSDNTPYEDSYDVEHGDNGERSPHVLLPSSVTNSPRYLQQQYMGSLRIIEKEGPGDLFITFTGNRNWDELNEIRAFQLETFRNDPNFGCDVELNVAEFVVRCFRLKLRALIHAIEVHQIFGETRGRIHVVEY